MQEKKKKETTTKLFVGNIPTDCTEGDLHQVLSTSGKIERLSLLNKRDGTSKVRVFLPLVIFYYYNLSPNFLSREWLSSFVTFCKCTDANKAITTSLVISDKLLRISIPSERKATPQARAVPESKREVFVGGFPSSVTKDKIEVNNPPNPNPSHILNHTLTLTLTLTLSLPRRLLYLENSEI
jgi:RNA recognition motif-containing protein